MSNNHMKFENGIQSTWTTIENGIIDDTESFDGLEKLTFIVCLRHAFQIGGQAYPSQPTIAAKVGCTDRTVRTHLSNLEKKGFLKKVGIHPETQTVIWRTLVPDHLKVQWMEKELERMKNKGKQPENEEAAADPADDKPKDEIPYKQIIDHLNERAGKNFRHTTAATKKAISGRWGDKFRLEDFIHVIDVKTEEWKGTDMEQHLNPDTLFRPSNFEKYLNQKPKRSKQPQFKKTQPKRSPGAAMTEEERRALLAEAGIPLD
jgi:uncharacterized phage protein (TIGR02220 family)